MGTLDAHVGRDAVVGKAGLPLLTDETALLQKTQVAGHSGLRDPQNRGELGDVEPLQREQTEEPETHLITEQAVQPGSAIHIY